jgi:hypothetical protein
MKRFFLLSFVCLSAMAAWSKVAEALKGIWPVTDPSLTNTTVDYQILDAQGRIVSTGERIENPLLWTAETPYLDTCLQK